MSRQGELKREFRKAGCRKVQEDTNHEKWHSPITNQYFQMGRHNNEELKKVQRRHLENKREFPKNTE